MPGERAEQASARIWSTEISQSFYQTLNNLHKKVGGGKSPRKPTNYRGASRRSEDCDEMYLLTYDEELHLADHFAFLAHVREGVEYVSAVTLEESKSPAALTVRLASNQTPTTFARTGLSAILRIVEEHANEGRPVILCYQQSARF